MKKSQKPVRSNTLFAPSSVDTEGLSGVGQRAIRAELRKFRWFAGFETDVQVTAWYRNREKVWSLMRRRLKERQHKANHCVIKSKWFIEQREISAGANGALSDGGQPV